MADIARLGFSADTGDLDKAKSKLTALVPAAKAAENATKGFNAAAAGLSGGKIGGALNSAAEGMSKVSKAALSASTAMGTVQSAAVGAAGGIERVTIAGVKQASFFTILSARWQAYLDGLRRTPGAADAAKSSLDRLGVAAGLNINRLQASPGNIAAQFQDIGVTAAGGMQPFLIALQQGTQLSAAFAGGGLKSIGTALAQMLSPLSLLTIGIVGLIATLIQMADWIAIGKGFLNGLADALEATAVYAAALGAVLLVAFAPQILTAIATAAVAIGGALVSAISAATVALIAFAIANPFTAIVLAIAAVVAAVVVMGEVFGGTFKDVSDGIKSTVNFLIGGFVGGFNAIKATWSLLPAAIGDATITAVNVALKGIDLLVNTSIERINGLLAAVNAPTITFRANSGQFKNDFAGKLKETNDIAAKEIGKAQGVDYVQGFINGAQGLGKRAAAALRGIAAGLGAEDGKDKKTKASDGPKVKSNDELFSEVIANADKQMRALQQAGAQIGVYGFELEKLRFTQQLFNEAQDKGVKLTADMTAKLNARATALATQATSNAAAAFTENTSQSLIRQTTLLTQQRDAIGLSSDQTLILGNRQKILNDLAAQHITLLPGQIAGLLAQADAASRLEINIRNTREALDFVRDGVKSFVSDLRGGLEQGKGFFSAFGDAVLNVLDKVLDKLIDVALNAALGGGGGGISGFLSGIAGLFGGGASAVSGANTSFAASASGFGGPFAKGGAFDRSGEVTAFAKGGVVGGPTLFKFAKGTGLMGEAGPEAIMPLKRGPDGSLGVQVNGGRSANDNSPRAAPVVNFNNSYVISGSSTADMQALVKQAAEQQRDQLRREVPAILTEYQTNGTIN